MNARRLGKTGWDVSEIGLGAWALGGDWGRVDEADAMATLHAAVDAGVTFIDTADVYGDGRSERLIGRLLREREERLIVATKLGRRAPLVAENWNLRRFREWAERSRENLGVERIDLVQLHSLPTDAYRRAETWEALDELAAEGTIAHYGASVERVEEGLEVIERPGVASVQIIFNLFRQRPGERFLEEARRRDVGVIARVPLASGLLTGKLRPDTAFAEDDHRRFNRHGEAFDVGETFSGVDYGTGLAAVEELRPLVPAGATMAQLALRWILMFEAVSTVIPGAKSPAQVRDNTAAAQLAPLPPGTMERAEAIYRDRIAPLVGTRW